MKRIEYCIMYHSILFSLGIMRIAYERLLNLPVSLSCNGEAIFICKKQKSPMQTDSIGEEFLFNKLLKPMSTVNPEKTIRYNRNRSTQESD